MVPRREWTTTHRSTSRVHIRLPHRTTSRQSAVYATARNQAYLLKWCSRTGVCLAHWRSSHYSTVWGSWSGGGAEVIRLFVQFCYDAGTVPGLGGVAWYCAEYSGKRSLIGWMTTWLIACRIWFRTLLELLQLLRLLLHLLLPRSHQRWVRSLV